MIETQTPAPRGARMKLERLNKELTKLSAGTSSMAIGAASFIATLALIRLLADSYDWMLGVDYDQWRIGPESLWSLENISINGFIFVASFWMALALAKKHNSISLKVLLGIFALGLSVNGTILLFGDLGSIIKGAMAILAALVLVLSALDENTEKTMNRGVGVLLGMGTILLALGATGVAIITNPLPGNEYLKVDALEKASENLKTQPHQFQAREEIGSKTPWVFQGELNPKEKTMPYFQVGGSAQWQKDQTNGGAWDGLPSLMVPVTDVLSASQRMAANWKQTMASDGGQVYRTEVGKQAILKERYLQDENQKHMSYRQARRALHGDDTKETMTITVTLSPSGDLKEVTFEESAKVGDDSKALKTKQSLSVK